MQISEIAEKVKNQGGNTYMVGGAVRDKLMKIQPKDYDFCVTGIEQKEFQALFPEAKIRGKSFPVFDLNGYQFALARTERKISDGHKGFKIESNKKITIEEDLKRRDVTINSIAIDVLKDEIIDPFNGAEDIKNKILRATSNAFVEDPLRVYRVAKLAARYEFNVDKQTLKMMQSLREELLTLPNARIYAELYDALTAKRPSIFFDVLRRANCLDMHYKEIYDLIGVEQPLEHHPEGDVYNHTMEVLDRAAQRTENVLIRFAALTHDFGKAKTPRSEWPHHYQHDKLGDKVVADMCNRLDMPNNFKKAGMIAAREHMRASMFNQMRPSTKVDFITSNYRNVLGLEGLEIIVNSDKKRDKDIKFAELGMQMVKEINGKNIMNQDNFQKIKEEIRLNRINWIKEKERKNGL